MLSVLRNDTRNVEKQELSSKESELLMDSFHPLQSDIGESGSHLLSLPAEVFSKITSFLDNSELFKLRKVSRRLKEVSDYALNSRNQSLVVKESNEYNVEGLFKVFRGLRSLEFYCTKRPFRDMLQHCFENCAAKFTKLIELRMFASVCEDQSLRLVGDAFANLQDLSLIWVQLNDSSLSSLLADLSQLKRIQVEGSLVSGACFASLCSNVEIIEFDTTVDVDVAAIFCNERPNLMVFRLTAVSLVNNEDFIDIVSRRAPNLYELNLKISSKILNIHRLKLPNLQCLGIAANEIKGEFKAMPEMMELKSLFLDVVVINEENLVTFIGKCCGIDGISISFSRNGIITLSNTFVQEMKRLKNLQEMCLYDTNYQIKKYSAPNSNTNVLIEVINSLYWLTDFDLVVDSMDLSYVESFVKSMQLVASKRCGYNFNVCVNKVTL